MLHARTSIRSSLPRTPHERPVGIFFSTGLGNSGALKIVAETPAANSVQNLPLGFAKLRRAFVHSVEWWRCQGLTPLGNWPKSAERTLILDLFFERPWR